MRILHPLYAEMWLEKASRRVIYKTMSFKDDYSFGLKSEDVLLSSMKDLYGSDIEKTDKFSRFDFSNKKTLIELKTRRNAKDTYPTTMVSASKVCVARNDPSKKYIFAFSFTDGVYYIEYDEKVFSEFETKQGGRFDRGRPELDDYCYIPVSKLKPLVPPTPPPESLQ